MSPRMIFVSASLGNPNYYTFKNATRNPPAPHPGGNQLCFFTVCFEVLNRFWMEMVISNHFLCKDLGTIIQLKQPLKTGLFLVGDPNLNLHAPRLHPGRGDKLTTQIITDNPF